MKRLTIFSVLFVVAMNFPLSAQNDVGNEITKRMEKLVNSLVNMLDSNTACSMLMMNATSPKAAFSTSDGGVIIIIGNKMMKYDKDLNLKKEVEIKADSTALRTTLENIKKCPAMVPKQNKPDSSAKK